MYKLDNLLIMDYASPVQFRFKCSKLPKVEFFCQTANIPGIGLGEQSRYATQINTNTW